MSYRLVLLLLGSGTADVQPNLSEPQFSQLSNAVKMNTTVYRVVRINEIMCVKYLMQSLEYTGSKC